MNFIPVTDDKLDPPGHQTGSGFREITEADLSPQQFTPVETFGMQATNVFGAGDIVGAAVNSVLRGKGWQDYQKWKDSFKQSREVAVAENPRAAMAGSVAAIVPEMALGGAVGKAVQAGSKAVGLASKIAPWAEANPIISKVLSGGMSGAGYGAASGAGEAASTGEDMLSGAVSGAGAGAFVGGAVGGVFGTFSKIFRGAGDRADDAVIKSIGRVDDTVRKDVLSIVRADKPLQKLIAKDAMAAGEAAAHRVDEVVAKFEPEFQRLEGKGVDALDISKAFADEISALSKTPLKERAVKELESVSDSVLKTLAHGKDATKAEGRTVSFKDIAGVIDELATGGGKRAERSADIFRTLRDKAFSSLDGEAKEAANAIKRLEGEKKALTAISDALKGKPESDGGIHKIISLFTHHGPVGAGLALAAGHPIPAAVLAAPASKRAADSALAMLQREAAAGNPKAIALLKSAGIIRKVGTAGAASVGATQNGTIAEQWAAQ